METTRNVKGLRWLLAAMFALALALVVAPAAAWADTTVTDGVTWSGDSTACTYDSTTGTLTISGDGTLTVSEGTTLSASIVIGSSSSSDNIKVTIVNNGTITSSSSHTVYIYSNATVTLSGGTYKCTANDSSNAGKAVVWNEGTCIISSGTYYNASAADKAYYTIVNNGTMTINGGSFSGDADASNSSLIINNQDSDKDDPATLTITGGTFETKGSACVKNNPYGTLTITGGTYTNEENYGIVNYATASVSSATIAGKRGIYNSADYGTDATDSVGTLTLSDCIINTTSYTIWNYTGDAEATVENCTLTSTDNYAVVNTAKSLTLEDCTISGTLGVYTSGSENETTITDCNVTATSESLYAIYNNASTTTVYGGTYASDGTAVYNKTTTDDNGNTSSGTITIYHGDFSDDSAESYLATTYTNDDGETVYTVLTEETNEEDGTTYQLVHALVAVDAVSATCTEDGNVAYYTCSYEDCSSCFLYDEDSGSYTEADYDTQIAIEATGHDYVVTKTVEATCTEDGYTTYTCSACGDTYTDTIEATGHTWGDPVYKWADDYSSCTVTLTCTVCGETLTLDLVVTSETDADGNTVYTAYYDGDGVGVSLTTTETVTTTETSDGGDTESDESDTSDEESELADTSDATAPLAAGAAGAALVALAAGAVALRRRAA